VRRVTFLHDRRTATTPLDILVVLYEPESFEADVDRFARSAARTRAGLDHPWIHRWLRWSVPGSAVMAAGAALARHALLPVATVAPGLAGLHLAAAHQSLMQRTGERRSSHVIGRHPIRRQPPNRLGLTAEDAFPERSRSSTMRRVSRRGPGFRLAMRYWNAVLAATSLVLIVAFTLVPGMTQYVDVLLVACAGAVTLMLIEIRLELDRERAAATALPYDNMRVARPDIVRRMSEVSKRSGSEEAQIVILGGRIRTVTDMLRDFAADITDAAAREMSARISVFAIDPEYMRNVRLPGDLALDRQERRNNDLAAMIEASHAEIRSLAESMTLRERKVTLTLSFYSFLPHYYCFLLDRRYLFWGFYTWEAPSSDLRGPDNRCYFMSYTHAEFEHYYHWFENRAAMLAAPVPASVVTNDGPST
jgi:hypothetical protein